MPHPKMDRGRVWALFAALALVSLLPHGDWASSENIERVQQRKMVLQSSNDLLSGLKQLRREASDLGLNKLSRMIAAVEEEVQRKIELFTPEELKPPATEETMQSSSTTTTTQPDTEKESKLETEGTDGTSDKVGEGVRFSNVASYQPVGKFDSFPEEAYAETFGELDQVVVDNQLTGQELTNLSQHLEDAAGKLNFLGYRDASPKGDNVMVGSRPRDAYEQALAPLLYKSFSEFLNRYASHLSEKALGKARLELSKEEQVGGELVNISGPPPKDGKFAIRGVGDEPNSKLPKLQGTPEQMKQVASQSASSFAKVRDGKTELGGSGAGVGSSSELGTVPGVLPRAEGGNYLPLEGKLSDGAAVIQVIHERGTRQLDSPSSGKVSFQEVLEQYAYGAEAELNSEQVPINMRDYIREYFRAIRPGQE